jgi:hypothetical protein
MLKTGKEFSERQPSRLARESIPLSNSPLLSERLPVGGNLDISIELDGYM